MLRDITRQTIPYLVFYSVVWLRQRRRIRLNPAEIAGAEMTGAGLTLMHFLFCRLS